MDKTAETTLQAGHPADVGLAALRAAFPQLVPPGLTDVWAWRPDSGRYWPPPPGARILGAVGRKPAIPSAGRPA